MKVYVVTSEVNEYDQHGEYFEGVFKTKEEAWNFAEGKSSSNIRHFYDGGGRINSDHTWINLRIVNLGE